MGRSHTALPRLSAVVIGGEQRARLERQVECLLGQTAIDSMEILIIDLQPHLSRLRAAEHPAVRHLSRGDLHAMWAAAATAAREARAEIIAYLEDHCFAEPGWAEALIDAYQNRDVAMVNYSFTDTGPHTYLSRAFSMTEYGRWMVPARAGPIKIASCNNISYRREVLLRYSNELGQWFQVEYLLHHRIRADGGIVWLEPGAIAAHENWSRLGGGLLANGAQKQFHAASLAKKQNWALSKRILYAGGMAVVPALHLWRLAASLVRRPTLWWQFFIALPVSTTVYCYMCLCEAAGYLFGPGSSEADFLKTELQISRKQS